MVKTEITCELVSRCQR